ncbi:MAG: sigma-70 family RNA polymerase sigma factor [Thermoleophilaceae bacterium]
MRGSASSPDEQRERSLDAPARFAPDAVRGSELLRAAQGGDRRSREQLVTSHLGLVRFVASPYRDLGLPLDDLVQEGSLGLLDAIDHYDPRHGATFEGYARFRVRRAIRNALTEQARLIRLPKQMVERRRAIARAEERLAAEAAGRAPTAAQLAADTGLSVAAVVDARSAGLAAVSLDEPILPDGSSLAGVVADPEAGDPQLTAIEHEQAELLRAALEKLPERQRRILSLRWGIGGAAMSNVELATELEVSPRRAQTIGRDALYELRAALELAEAAP